MIRESATSEDAESSYIVASINTFALKIQSVIRSAKNFAMNVMYTDTVVMYNTLLVIVAIIQHKARS